jgi:O-acetylserine/cysteine efflux transporter
VRFRDVLIAVAVVVIWGVNFVAIDAGLTRLPPLLFVALRFLFTAFPVVFFVPRPAVGVRAVVMLGMLMCVGQFGLLFVGMSEGMPAGLASVVMQAQAVFTAVFAAAVLRERPGRVQVAGLVVAVAGLALIGAGRGSGVPLGAVLLLVGGAACWGAANVVTRAARSPHPFSLLIYSALVAPVPLVGLSLLVEGPATDWTALQHLNGPVLLSMTYVVVLATFVGFGAWYLLLGRYASSSVAPFALLVPVSGLSSAWLMLGEVPTAVELIGSATAILGVGLVVAGGRTSSVPAGHPPASALPAGRVRVGGDT